MIVTYQENGFEVVLQRHHAKLSAGFMEELKWIQKDEHRLDLILAAGMHDNDYNEFRISGLLNAVGGPKDYKMEKFVEADCDRLLDEALATSQFIAVLIALHIQFVMRDISAKASRYCQTLEIRKEHWCKSIGLPIARMQRYYAMLQWCDAISLLLCQRSIPPEGRHLEISKGPDDISYFIYEAEAGHYIVDPWPFQERTFALKIEKRRLKDLKYKSDSSLRMALTSSAVIFEEIVFKSKP